MTLAVDSGSPPGLWLTEVTFNLPFVSRDPHKSVALITSSLGDTTESEWNVFFNQSLLLKREQAHRSEQRTV